MIILKEKKIPGSDSNEKNFSDVFIFYVVKYFIFVVSFRVLVDLP